LDTLLLGQSYEPLARVSWRRAMTLWVSGRVEILEEYPDRPIRTVRAVFPTPAVIRFYRSVRRHRPALRYSRDHVYARDAGRCQYCASALTRRECTYDHIVPRSRGGQTRWENIVLACRPCNQRKGNRTPVEARMRLLVAPRPPRPAADFWCLALASVHDLPEPWRPYLGHLVD